MEKNKAGKWVVFAYGSPTHATLAGKPITGDAANITANVRIDGGAANAVDDTNPTELEDGYYVFDITAAESNGTNIVICPASSTAHVIVIGVPGATWTTPGNFNDLSITDTTGRVDLDSIGGTAQTANDNGLDINTLLTRLVGTIAAGTHNAQSGDSFSRIGANGSGLTGIPWNAAWDAEVESEVADGLAVFFGSAASLVDLIWNEVISGHLTAGTAGLYIAIAGGVLLDTTVTGTPSATSVDITGGAATTDFYQDQLAWIISGTGVAQVKVITNSSESGGVTTLSFDSGDGFKVVPASGDRIIVQMNHVHSVSQIQSGLALETSVQSIKTKTDQLIFTKANELDVNIISINDVTIVGDGSATPFNV